MPERGWTALTVRECVDARIKELARSQGLTASDHLRKLIVTRRVRVGLRVEYAARGLRPRA